MPVVPLPDLLAEARSGGYAVGYFEAWDGYSLEAVVEAAEAERAPVILGFGCLLVDQGWLDAGGIERLGLAGRVVAERARVPAAFLLNEAPSIGQALRGLDAGFNAAMVHGADVETVAELTHAAHARGAAVEGEVGEGLTEPEEAARFVAATGVDCLAAWFGNVHAHEGGSPTVDLDRLEAVHRRVPVPLVVHGASSFPPEAVGPAIERGVAKFNVGTVVKQAFLEGLADAVGAGGDPHALLGSHGPADVLGAGKSRMVACVRELIRLFGGSGRAG